MFRSHSTTVTPWIVSAASLVNQVFWTIWITHQNVCLMPKAIVFIPIYHPPIGGGKFRQNCQAVPRFCPSSWVQTPPSSPYSILSGNAKAWPVYISIRNISKSVRYLGKQQGLILLGYLPMPHCKPLRLNLVRSHSNLNSRRRQRALKLPFILSGNDRSSTRLLKS